MFIPEKKYREIVQVIPILCIDALIINNKNEYLLLKRLNEPLKNVFWVPGGRVLHLEKTVHMIQHRLDAMQFRVQASLR